MSNRKRVIYQSETVYVGPTPATGEHYNPLDPAENYIKQLSRIQTTNYSYSVTRQDINQFGELAAIDRIILESPTVSLDFSYYLTNGANEWKLGLSIDGNSSAISGILNGTEDEKNYFISTSPEGTDNIGFDPVNREVIAIGNGFMSNYSVEAAVGGLPTVSVTIEALNIKADPTASGEPSPAINPVTGLPIEGINYILPKAVHGEIGEISALRPGDIEINVKTPWGAKVSGEGRAHFQNISLAIPLAREPLQELGNKFAFSREVTYPVTVTLNATANMADYVYGSLSDILCKDELYDLEVIFREPVCSGQGPISVVYYIKGAKLDSQSWTTSIGANKSVDLVWSSQIGSNEDLTKGVQISGSFVPPAAPIIP